MQRTHPTSGSRRIATATSRELGEVSRAAPASSVLAELTFFLSSRPTATAKLLAQHVDDGRGYCTVCTIGAQRGHHIWPCTIYTAAARAARQDSP